MASSHKSNFHFIAEWGGSRTDFLEISGLSIETEILEYRDGASPDVIIKTPGQKKYANLVLRRMIKKGDSEFYTWMNTAQGSSVLKRNVIIKLLNKKNERVMSWKAANAWPVKFEAADLKGNANEVAFETLELTHDGLTFVN